MGKEEFGVTDSRDLGVPQRSLEWLLGKGNIGEKLWMLDFKCGAPSGNFGREFGT